MISKYTFADITVFQKVGGGEYINISDYDVAGVSNERRIFKSQSQYIIMLHSFSYERCLSLKSIYVCDITVDELVALAGINNHRFIEGFKNNEDILALMCARKIYRYNYGLISKKDEYTYDFCRIANVNVNELVGLDGYRYVKRHRPVFTKTFYKAC